MVGNGYQTGAADPGFYQNQLKNLVSNPGSFSGTPGFQFALNQGLGAVNAQNSTIRGSGNALAALQDRASGMASQNYMGYLGALGGLQGQEQNYDLGLAGANNTAQGNANQYALGSQQNANTATRNANDYTLGMGQNANSAQRNANDYSLGNTQAANQYALGSQSNANTAQNNWWNYNLGNQQNTNQYNLGQYNAETNRGAAQSNANTNAQNSLLDWTRFGYQLNPGQRVAGTPGTRGGGWPGVG